MEETPLTVRRPVGSFELLAAGQTGELLNFLRRHVRQLRRENPVLRSYRLHDVGFVPRGTRIELRFYFLRATSEPLRTEFDPE